MKICHVLFFAVFAFSALAEDTNAPSSRQAREFDWVRHWATGTPSTNLVRLIAGTDRIVVTNRMASGIAQYRGFNLTLSGGETRKIVRDVSSMVSFSSTRPPTGEANAIFAWELRFYQGTNYLTSIYLAESMAEDIFEFGDEQYGGDTGALKALSDRLHR